MAEYEDRYPDAYGRREEAGPEPRRRHFLGRGLPRQVRDSGPPAESVRPAGGTPWAPPAPQPRHVERLRRPLDERSPQEICDDVAEQLAASPFIDASDITITVDGTEVTLDGTINSLIAISLAQALASNVPGVGRVQVQLRVRQTPRSYEPPADPARKIEE
jgi:hypothetical protein